VPLLLLPILSAAQPASVSGVVRDAISGAPIYQALVSDGKTVVRTDLAGSYSFDDAGPGAVRIALPEGLLTTAGRNYVTVTVGAGQHLKGVDFLIEAPATVSGRVLDADKKPVAGVSVGLLRRDYAAGIIRHSGTGAGTITDRDGSWQLTAQAGRSYLLVVAAQDLTADSKADAPEPKQRPFAIPPTYYPGVTEFETATPLVFRSGEVRDGIEITVHLAPTYCVDGVFEIDGRPAAVPYISEQEDSERMPIRRGPHGTTNVDGHFRNCRVFPGMYSPYVTGTADPKALKADRVGTSASFTIRNGDLHDVRIGAQSIPTTAVGGVWPAIRPTLPPRPIFRCCSRRSSRCRRCSRRCSGLARA
jgi:hypothetical protein